MSGKTNRWWAGACLPLLLLWGLEERLGGATRVNAGEFNRVRNIGDAAPAWRDLPGVDGKSHSLSDLAESKVVVVVFTCNSCPYAVDVEDRLIDLVKRFQSRKVAVVAINVNKVPEDLPAAMKERAEEKGFNFPYLYDATQAIAREYGASRTPEFFVLDGERKIVYMGAMDDSPDGTKIQRRHVESAIEAVLAGERPALQETISIGCLVRFERSRRKPTSVLAPGAKPELLQETGAGEGPAWHDELGLLTSGDGHVMRRDLEGRQSIHIRDAGSNGLMFDKRGRLVMCQAVARRVVRYELDGQVTVLAETYDGKRFNQPNDLTMDSQGRIYFSDPRYGSREGMELEDAEGRKVEGVYRIDPDGQVTRVITHEVDRPNGLVVTADDRYLFVADNNNDTEGGARKLWRFELRADGAVDSGSRKLIHDWGRTRGPDGIKLDVEGRLYVAGGLNRQNPPFEVQDEPTAGVYVFSPAGTLLERIPIPRDECTNCAFGGQDRKTLFITAGGSLWSVRTATAGK